MSAGVHLRGLSMAVPPTILPQPAVRDVFGAQPGLNRLAQRIIGTSFDVSGIERRYTVLEELTFDDRGDDPTFFDRTWGADAAGHEARNEIYAVEATKLYLEAARLAIAATPGVDAADITHVVTVSCTGFYAPGPDYMLVRDLGLGGRAALPPGIHGLLRVDAGLRRAMPFCEADPDAVVLVVSVELCTLHLRSSNDPDTIVASSLFADGAGAGIVTARPLAGERAFALDRFETRITPVGEGDMAWKIGDHGFEDGALQRGPRDHRRPHHRRARAAVRPDATSPTRWRRMPRASASRTGPSIRAGAASSTRSSRACSSARPSSCPHAPRCATSATCRARPCCSCCGTSSTRPPPPTATASQPWRSARAHRRVRAHDRELSAGRDLARGGSDVDRIEGDAAAPRRTALVADLSAPMGFGRATAAPSDAIRACCPGSPIPARCRRASWRTPRPACSPSRGCRRCSTPGPRAIPLLREWIAAREGLPPERIVITSGGFHGLALARSVGRRARRARRRRRPDLPALPPLARARDGHDAAKLRVGPRGL